MADTTHQAAQAAQTATTKVAITTAEIQATKTLQQQFANEVNKATTEYTLSLYSNLLRALKPSLAKISQAQLIEDRRQQNLATKAKRDALKAAKKNGK